MGYGGWACGSGKWKSKGKMKENREKAGKNGERQCSEERKGKENVMVKNILAKEKG